MTSEAPLVFLVAGEPSGDALGGRLMAALKRRTGGQVRFAGVGGEAMAAEGMESLFPMTDLSIIGVFEVLPHAKRIFARMAEAAAAVDRLQPAAVVTIDAPAFAHGFVRRIRTRSIPRIHYVAPSVWAWRPWRVRKFQRNFDHLLALLPFEPPHFEQAGLACTFVGHPAIEEMDEAADGPAFRASHGIGPDDSLLCVLPGSRRSEVERLIGIFGQTIAAVSERLAPLHVVVPTVAGVEDLVRDAVGGWPVPVTVVLGRRQRQAAMVASNAALAASGTVALELAAAGVPSVICYRLPLATYLVLRGMVRVRFANLINIILDEAVVPERLQRECRPDLLCDDLLALLGPSGRDQIRRLQPALKQLRPQGQLPSERAAEAILQAVERK